MRLGTRTPDGVAALLDERDQLRNRVYELARQLHDARVTLADSERKRRVACDVLRDVLAESLRDGLLVHTAGRAQRVLEDA